MKRVSIIAVLASLSLSMSGQLFWKVTGNGLEKESYILGTMHDAPVSMIDEISGLNDAIQNCDVAIGEVDKNDQGSQIDMMELMVPPDSTLDKLLSPEDYHIVEKVVNMRLESTGVTMDQLLMFRPGLIRIIALDTDLSALSDSDSKEMLFDLAILDRAAAAGHPTMGLETKTEHVEWLIKAPLKDQARWLLSMCKNYDNQEGLDDAYIRQDATVTFESRVTDEGYRDFFVNQRNRNWAEKLDKLMPEKSCLVCVGAAHLSGEKGLLQLLRDLGYTVEPMQ